MRPVFLPFPPAPLATTVRLCGWILDNLPRSAARSERLLARRGRGPNFCADSTLKRQPQGMAAPAGPRAQRFRQAVLHAVREQCVVQLLLFISATSGEWRGGGTAPHGSSSPHSAHSARNRAAEVEACASSNADAMARSEIDGSSESAPLSELLTDERSMEGGASPEEDSPSVSVEFTAPGIAMDAAPCRLEASSPEGRGARARAKLWFQLYIWLCRRD